jgi:vancomycin resistance protein YoaR
VPRAWTRLKKSYLAQSSDLKALELYSALSSLPKRLEVDEENAEDNGAAKGKAKELPERIVARNRNRKAVEERLRAQNRAETEELDSESNPKIKRARSEGTKSAPTEDVVMD